MSDITVRKALPEDIPEIAEIGRKCFPEAWTEDCFREEMEQGNIVLAAVWEGRVIGYLTGACVVDWADIYNVAVLARYRRKGAATELLKQFFRVLTPEAEIAALEVRVSNLGAIELYQKMGFRQVGRRRDFYREPREDALLMSKNLKTGK